MKNCSKADIKKKEREKSYLLQFLKKHDATLIQAIDDENVECPDFNIGTIGVEIRELYPDAKIDHGSPLKAIESHEEAIRISLLKKLQESNLPYLHVSIHFHSKHGFAKIDTGNIVYRLFETIQNRLWQNGTHCLIESWDQESGVPVQKLPDGIDSLNILCAPESKSHFVGIPFTVWESPLTTASVQKAIDEKENAKKKYRQCLAYWLILILESKKGSGTYEIQHCLESMYRSSFDKVFLFDTFSQERHALILQEPYNE